MQDEAQVHSAHLSHSEDGTTRVLRSTRIVLALYIPKLPHLSHPLVPLLLLNLEQLNQNQLKHIHYSIVVLCRTLYVWGRETLSHPLTIDVVYLSLLSCIVLTTHQDHWLMLLLLAFVFFHQGD